MRRQPRRGAPALPAIRRGAHFVTTQTDIGFLAAAAGDWTQGGEKRASGSPGLRCDPRTACRHERRNHSAPMTECLRLVSFNITGSLRAPSRAASGQRATSSASEPGGEAEVADLRQISWSPTGAVPAGSFSAGGDAWITRVLVLSGSGTIRRSLGQYDPQPVSPSPDPMRCKSTTAADWPPVIAAPTELTVASTTPPEPLRQGVRFRAPGLRRYGSPHRVRRSQLHQPGGHAIDRSP